MILIGERIFLPKFLKSNFSMKAFVFPGQGAQFPGMGKDIYEQSECNSTGNLFTFRDFG